jgi:Mg2+ and Co2+ transporter CorA
MDQGAEPSTVRKPLHPASRRLADMEQKMIQLYEIVGNMATRLGTVAETQDSSAKALAGLCQNHTTQIVTQAAAIRSLQEQTSEIIEAQGASILSLQAETGIMKMQIAELEQSSGKCSRRITIT